MADIKQENIGKAAISRLSDAALLADLHALCFPGQGWSEQSFAAFLARDNVSAYGHEDGFVLVQNLPDGSEILTLAVRPGQRRQGMARALLGFLDAGGAAQEIWLEVGEDNVAARALYRSAGFVETGRRRGYYKRAGNLSVDAVLMKRVKHD